MNILVSVFHFPPMSGGGAVLSSEIVNSFFKQGHKVWVVVPGMIYFPARIGIVI